MTEIIVEAPQSPTYLLRDSKIERSINIVDNYWRIRCRKRDLRYVLIHIQDIGVRVVPEEELEAVLAA
jgi:hypothetical protein